MIHKRSFLCAVLLLIISVASRPARAQQSDTDSNAPSAKIAGNLEVLSDTHGVDFGPYLSDLITKVRTNWYNLIPEQARPPQLEAGKTSIEFAILPDGRVAGMKLVNSSGNRSLDRAAWGRHYGMQPF